MPFVRMSDIPGREMVPGFKAQFIHTEHMTCARWTIAAGASLPDHAHPHEQVTMIVHGAFEMTVEGETRTIEPGDVILIPSGARHRGRAVTDCNIFDVFTPVREDYR